MDNKQPMDIGGGWTNGLLTGADLSGTCSHSGITACEVGNLKSKQTNVANERKYAPAGKKLERAAKKPRQCFFPVGVGWGWGVVGMDTPYQICGWFS